MFDGKEYVYAVYEEKSFFKSGAEAVYHTAGPEYGRLRRWRKRLEAPIF